MATLRENLETARANIVLELATMDQSKRTYSHAGQSEQWDAHRDSLLRSLEKINGLLAMGGDNLDQLWEEQSIGMT